jgi:hypothetical protein
MSTIRAEDLKVGDRVEYYTFDDNGAEVVRIIPYNGPLRDIILAHVDLRGKSRTRGDWHTMKTAVEHGQYLSTPKGKPL